MMDEKTKRLYRIRRTVMEMLRDRGYLVGDFEINMTEEEFTNKFGEVVKRESLVINKAMRNDTSNQIYVFFPEERVGVKSLTTIMSNMKAENVWRAILVVEHELTSFAKEHIVDHTERFHLEVFQDAELLMNVTEHVLVPVHQVLTTEEKTALLERYKLKETQLPRIQTTDPIARYYGIKRGQVVKIIRSSETAGRYVNYRYCV